MNSPIPIDPILQFCAACGRTYPLDPPRHPCCPPTKITHVENDSSLTRDEHGRVMECTQATPSVYYRGIKSDPKIEVMREVTLAKETAIVATPGQIKKRKKNKEWFGGEQ